MSTIIRFTDKEIEKVRDFAEKIKWKHPHFLDNKNKSKRTQEQVKDSVILGKLAEVAVHKYFIEHSSEAVSEIDFNIYKEGETDDHDIQVGSKVICIKSSKMGSNCLMIEKQKFKEDGKGNVLLLEKKELPDYFVFVRVNTRNFDYYAELVGVISSKEFWKRKKFMPRGLIVNRDNLEKYLVQYKRLPELEWDTSKGGKLLAENYGVHAKRLSPFATLLTKRR